MSEITLEWTNKRLVVRARGSEAYEWIDPSRDRQTEAPSAINLSGRHPGRHSNVIAVGDGLDALVALAASGDVLADKIRLVYIDPPFNTSADVQCYSDTMDRSMWLGMLRDRLVALLPHLSDDASVSQSSSLRESFTSRLMRGI